jgi:hypothetical protein
MLTPMTQLLALQTRQVRLRLFVELKFLGLYSRHVLD